MLLEDLSVRVRRACHVNNRRHPCQPCVDVEAVLGTPPWFWTPVDWLAAHTGGFVLIEFDDAVCWEMKGIIVVEGSTAVGVADVCCEVVIAGVHDGQQIVRARFVCEWVDDGDSVCDAAERWSGGAGALDNPQVRWQLFSVDEA